MADQYQPNNFGATPPTARGFRPRRMDNPRDLSSPQVSGVPNSGGTAGADTFVNPQSRLKQTIGQMVAGRLRGASQANQGRLEQQGIADIPGVQAAVSTRMQGEATDQLASTYAGIDQQARQEAEQKRQADRQYAFAKMQYDNARSDAEKAFWQDIMGSVLGAGAAILAAPVTGGGSVAGYLLGAGK